MEKNAVYPAPSECPVCGEALQVTQLTCRHCHTRLEGTFAPGKLGRLNAEQCRFVEVFLAARGNLREAGKVLNLSYPTMRTRLDGVLNAMGVTPVQETPTDVLQQLQKGEISLEDALDHFEDR